MGDALRIGPDRGCRIDAAQGRVAGVQRQADAGAEVILMKASKSAARSTTVPR